MEIKNLAQQYIYWPEIDNQYQKNINFSKTLVTDLKQLFHDEINSDSIRVEKSIVNFYALNEILAKLRSQENEILDKEALNLYKTYTEEIEATSKKLYAYIFFITLMEARHCHDLSSLRSFVDSLESEDYDTVREHRRELERKFSSVFNKNEEKLQNKIKEVKVKYGNLEYEYSHADFHVYSSETEKISNHYYKVRSKIHSYLDFLETKFSENLRESFLQRLKEYREERTEQIINIFLNKEGTPLRDHRNKRTEINEVKTEYVDKETFEKFLVLNERLGKISGYNRSGVYDTIMPALDSEEFKDFTIEDLQKCVVNIFAYGNFNGGYGGIPWAKIAAHNLNFTRGNINAEVFVDQSFSLEHNNGNMFNKNIIYNNPGAEYWKTYAVENLKLNKREESNYHQVNNCQFLLNAQHQGQLLALLNFDHLKLESKIHSDNLSNDIEKIMKSGVIPKHYTKDNLYNIDSALNENLNSLVSVTKRIKKLNKVYNENREEMKPVGIDFTEILANHKVEIPQLNLYTILNGCKTDGGTYKLDENHQIFHSLTTYQINKYTNPPIQKTESDTKYEFNFTYLNTQEIPEDLLKKELLGNKAFGLAKMHEMDLPVPQALVFPTTNAGSFFNEKAKWLKFLRPQLKEIQKQFTNSNGDPIACSVRSGSSISMPGMMDTILNVGIDDSNYHHFCNKMGKKVTQECIIKFMSLFTKSLFNEEIHFSGTFNKALYQFREVLNRHNVPQSYEGMFPLNARQQYKWCLQAVFSSWHSERANAYRNHQNISHDIGTAAIVQQMVFGNLNEKSCTGVVFSRDCISGDKGIIGEFLPKAQGEDVVSGAVTPLNIVQLKDFNPKVYSELIGICERLEKDTGDIQDIEFTVEDGKLYILQKRKAVCSAIAQTRLNKELFDDGLITKEQMLKTMNVESLISKDIVDAGVVKPEIKGLVGNPGVLRGIVVRSEADMMTYAKVYDENRRDSNFGWIFYAPETSPDHAPIMLKTHGFITSNGGFTSHAAILARSWDKPCVVGVGHADSELLKSGAVITMDANNGHVYSSILPVKEGSRAEINNIVNEILDYYQINIEDLAKEGSLNKEILEVNSKKSWMEQYTVVENTQTNTIKTDKFLDLGYKVALMLVKAQEDSKKMTNANMESIKSLLDNITKEAEERTRANQDNNIRLRF